LGHDVKINCFNVLNPNVQISGEVSIGNKNLFGFNSGISQTRKIGDGNVLGAGSILIRNINDNSTYIGVPAKKFSI
jgi:UDP-3-O-[3-hydroxymyristoyl] glucosamine N-acyltransferase